MTDHDITTVERLAKALYETAAGSDGYPPLHRSFPWAQAVHSQKHYRERAVDVLRLLDLKDDS